MNAELQKLIELDKTNQEVTRLKDEIAGLPKRMAAIEAKLAGAQKSVEEANNSIKSYESQKRSLESDIKDWQQKIVRFREQSAAVKTNEQYKALMHEIEFAEKQISDCEEKILIGMESSDGLHKVLAAAQAELKADTAEVEQEKEHARAVTTADEKRLKELGVQLDLLKKTLPDNMVLHYERVAAKRKGAISEAFEQKCMACNVMLRPQHYNELLSGSELITCDSCGRILYVDPNRQTAAVKPVMRTEKAVLFVSDGAESGRFYALANSKAGCTMRVYDAASGLLIEKAAQKKTNFQEAYPEVVRTGTVLRAEAAHIEDAAEQLSPDALEELQLQAQIAPGAVEKMPTVQ